MKLKDFLQDHPVRIGHVRCEMKRIAPIFIVLLSLVLALPVLAQRPGRGHRGRRGHHGNRRPFGALSVGPHLRGGIGALFRHPKLVQKELKVTKKQVAKIQKINLQFMKQRIELQKKIVPQKLELTKLLLEEKVALGKVKKTLNTISGLLVQFQMLKLRHRLAVEKVLTKGQRAALRRFILQRRHGRKMRGMGQHRHRGAMGHGHSR